MAKEESKRCCNRLRQTPYSIDRASVVLFEERPSDRIAELAGSSESNPADLIAACASAAR
ncbi:hypothetical protein ACLBWT_04515 [Paenibacillus sp. D51F]